MKNETIEPLKKILFIKENVVQAEASGCCGGTPVTNEDACCKLDEEKKAEGESGCGCNTSANSKKKASCC